MQSRRMERATRQPQNWQEPGSKQTGDWTTGFRVAALAAETPVPGC
jgi:hypothetical protein